MALAQVAADAKRRKELLADGLLTVDEVMKLTTWAESTVYAMAARKAFPTLRLGRKIAIPRRGLMEYLEAHIEL